MSNATISMKPENLQNEALHYEEIQEIKKAAEIYYALAVILKDDPEKARQFGDKSVSLLKMIPSSTIDDCVNYFQSINDVVIPEIFHDNVVKSRLSDLNIQLS